MIPRISLICALAIFFISACGKDQKAEAPAAETAQVGAEGTVPAPLVADKEAGKQLAEKCQECHGNDGNKTVDGSPYLSGQQTDYLQLAMKSYLSGEREHEAMKSALQDLTDADLLNLAAYYNDQKPDWKQIKSTEKPKGIVVNKRTIALGKNISSRCSGCHGEKGSEPIDGSPAIAGLQPLYFKSAFLDYFKANRREKKDIMKHFSRSLSKSDIAHLATYYSVQTPKKTQFPIKGNATAGKNLATQACDGCHGMGGNSGNPTIPSLTGQNTSYLVFALNTYKNGMRKNKMMKDAVASLKKSQMVNLAAYYAKQKPKKMSATETKLATGFDPIGQGGNIAAACNGCHGANGNSSVPGTPSLSGLNPQYITSAITAYKNGQRKHEMMKGFVANLSESDMEKVSLYYAAQEPTAMVNSIKADAAAGESLASACTACHGDHGDSSQANTPSIAGQEPGYIVTAMNDYKSGKRQDEAMKNAVAELSEASIKNYAAYFAAQARSKPEIRAPEAPEVLAEKCIRCHGEKGLSADGKIPRLAGQLESYLLNALQQYGDESRKNSTMHAMSSNLSPLEQKAIAEYFAQQK